MIKVRSLLVALTAIVTAFSAGLTAQETAAPAAPKTVTFKTQKLVKGDKAIVNTDNNFKMSMKVDMDGQTMMEGTQSSSMKSTAVITVNETKEGKLSKVTMFFKKVTVEEVLPEGPMGEQASGDEDMKAMQDLEGKTYQVDLSAAPAKITNEKGEAVPESDAKTIRKQFINDKGVFTGLGPNINKVVPDGDMKIGTKIDLTPAMLGEMMGMDDDEQMGDPTEFLSGHMTLTGTRKVLGVECGVFELVAKIDATLPEEAGGMTIKAAPKGEMLVGLKNKWVYRGDIKGEMKMAGEMEAGEGGPVITMNGTGTVKTVGVNTYLKEKKAEK